MADEDMIAMIVTIGIDMIAVIAMTEMIAMIEVAEMTDTQDGNHILVHHHLATEGVVDPHRDLGAGLILSQGPDLPCQIETVATAVIEAEAAAEYRSTSNFRTASNVFVLT